jgi:hypothetical protein
MGASLHFQGIVTDRRRPPVHCPVESVRIYRPLNDLLLGLGRQIYGTSDRGPTNKIGKRSPWRHWAVPPDPDEGARAGGVAVKRRAKAEALELEICNMSRARALLSERGGGWRCKRRSTQDGGGDAKD